MLSVTYRLIITPRYTNDKIFCNALKKMGTPNAVADTLIMYILLKAIFSAKKQRCCVLNFLSYHSYFSQE